MNAKEIRIGNKIFNGNGKIIDVSYHEIRYAQLYKDNNYKPIPLTAEILEVCGFIKSNEFERWYLITKFPDSKYEEMVLDIEKDVVWWWTIDDVGDNEGSKSREIKYLHQLQNLYYAITFKELEIKLNSPATV